LINCGFNHFMWLYFVAESLVRCIAWSRLGVNGCFVPKADIARNNVAQRKNAIIYNWVGN
ncbi:hypothetical protein, partial [Serratia ureilytica]|uniref:hypothetical protein n=1 Tax=Serratia ureilytica TaxID=300181 RepID=UPI003F7ECF6E